MGSTARIFLAVACVFLALPALALEPVAKGAADTDRGETTGAWLNSHDGDVPLVYIHEMDYDFHKLLVAEIQRRNKIDLPITTLEDKATFKLSGEISRKEDIMEREGRRKGFNGARHFAMLTMVSAETGQIVWSCNQDDRDKFDFNSTGKTFRRVAERCTNLLVKEITGK